MDRFLVTFEIEKPIARFQIANEILKYDGVQLSPTSFVVCTSEGNDAVFRKLQAHLGEMDSLYVLTLEQPFSGVGLKSVIDWLGDAAEKTPAPQAASAKLGAPANAMDFAE